MPTKPAFSILIETESVQPRLLLADGTFRESHTDTSTPTQYPVGSGALVTDHIQEMPSLFVCELVVTETPNQEIPSAPLAQDFRIVPADDSEVQYTKPSRPLEPYERAANLHRELNLLRRTGTLCTVTSALRRQPNMAIIRLEAPLEGPDGVIAITVEWQEMRVVNSLIETAVLVEEPRLRSASDRGNQQSEDVTNTIEAPSRSVGASLLALIPS